MENDLKHEAKLVVLCNIALLYLLHTLRDCIITCLLFLFLIFILIDDDILDNFDGMMMKFEVGWFLNVIIKHRYPCKLICI